MQDAELKYVFEILFRLKDHKELIIRKCVVNVIPNLAKFNTQLFVSEYLDTSIVYLLGQLRKEKEKNFAFLAVGEIAVAVGQDIAQYLESIFQIIKESFIMKQKNTVKGDVKPLLQCISLLVIAVGPVITKFMHEILDLMFQFGLSDALTTAALDLSTHIPPLNSAIQGLHLIFYL